MSQELFKGTFNNPISVNFIHKIDFIQVLSGLVCHWLGEAVKRTSISILQALRWGWMMSDCEELVVRLEYNN